VIRMSDRACALCNTASGSASGAVRSEPGPRGRDERGSAELEVQWICDSCIREHVPSIESRLNRAWWESAPPAVVPTVVIMRKPGS
jgi:hypothetical protein